MSLPEARVPAARDWQVWLALLTLYIVWGSTYLAIRVMVETIPPLIGAGTRFLAAGTILLFFLIARRDRATPPPTLDELVAAGILGILILFGGFGLLTVAERQVESGLAALLIASVPLWVVLLRITARERVSKLTIIGVMAGLAGVALLVTPSSRSGDAPLLWLFALVVAALCEAVGSFGSGRLRLPADAFLSAACQMLVAGVLLCGAGLATGEAGRLQVNRFSLQSILGLAYLIGPGSLLAYSAFVWVLYRAPISTVSTYAYVNPLVAILLGWSILDEALTPAMAVGGTLVVLSVAVVVRPEAPPDLPLAEATPLRRPVEDRTGPEVRI